MYPITAIGRRNFLKGRKQYCNITITNDHQTISFNESRLLSLKFTRKTSSGQNISLGEAIATQLDFALDNYDGYFNGFDFGGSEASVQLGVQTDADPYYIPIGYFTIDSTPRVLSQINVSTLDRMVQFDKEPSGIEGWFPLTIKSLVERICTACNVPLATDLTTFPNANYVVDYFKTDTYRELLMYALEIMGKCAFINWNGELEIGWYTDNAESDLWGGTFIWTDGDDAEGGHFMYGGDTFDGGHFLPWGTSEESIDESLRFISDLKDPITFGGVKLTIGEDSYEIGEGHKFNIENPLVKDETILHALNTNITLYPFNATTMPLPYIYPLDGICFMKDGKAHVTFVSGISFEMNGACTIECVGEITELSYARINPLTSREKNIIEQVKREFNQTLNQRVQELSHLNELVFNAMGFYKTEQIESGATIFYMHDAPLLSESHKVWKMTVDGFFWTEDYQSGVWQRGISSSGDAWFNKVSAIGLTLASGSEFSSHFTPEQWDIMRGTMAVMQVTTQDNEVQMRIPKLVIDDPSTTLKDGYLEVGKIRITPVNVNGECVGTGIIMVD